MLESIVVSLVGNRVVDEFEFPKVGVWLLLESIVGSLVGNRVVDEFEFPKVGVWLLLESIVGFWLLLEAIVGAWLLLEAIVGAWLLLEAIVGVWLGDGVSLLLAGVGAEVSGVVGRTVLGVNVIEIPAISLLLATLSTSAV